MFENPEVFELHKFVDDRGEFTRLFCLDTIGLGIDAKIKHVNCSRSAHKGTVRGMHFQTSPFEEIKLITCTQGEVLDVCINMRKNSSSFGEVHYCHLKQEDSKVFLVPNGFAHGFQSLTDNSEIVYSNTAEYAKDYEINVNPLSHQIKWLEPVRNLSSKDSSSPHLSKFLKD